MQISKEDNPFLRDLIDQLWLMDMQQVIGWTKETYKELVLDRGYMCQNSMHTKLLCYAQLHISLHCRDLISIYHFSLLTFIFYHLKLSRLVAPWRQMSPLETFCHGTKKGKNFGYQLPETISTTRSVLDLVVYSQLFLMYIIILKGKPRNYIQI